MASLPKIFPQDVVVKLTECIRNKIPTSFSKYGDGEYYCAMKTAGHNCDKDNYTDKLSNALVESFKYMIDAAGDENTFIGMWHDEDKCQFWQSLVENKAKINWAEYHTFIVDVKDFHNKHENNDLKNKIELYRSIQETKLKKYVVCNPLMIKSRLLFKADELLKVPFQNWFDDYFDHVLNLLKDKIGNDPQPVIITACGMGAKVLIAELHKLYPRGIFLDLGSAMDLLCTRRDSRGRMYSYMDIYNEFRSLLPDDWHDPKWENIYQEARFKMGLHIF